MIVYLIRHGETEYNKQRRLQGRTNIELNAYGEELARITGQGLQDIEFDLIITSPLSRAKKTAEIILGEQNNLKKASVVEDARIQEISFGDYEGLCSGKHNYNIPDPSFQNFFDAPECYQIPPNGESFEEIIKRTGEFWQELLGREDYADKTLLISTHGCALKAILANINQTPISQFWGGGVHKNCAVTIVEIVNGQAKVVEEGKVFY